MMNDWRDRRCSYEDENTFSVKMVAAAVVAVGFLGVGTFAYETGGAHPQTMQAVASSPFAPLAATTASASAAPNSPSDLTSPEAPATAAEPLKSAEAGTAPVTAPALQSVEKPVQSAEASSPPVTPAAKAPAKEKLVKVSRAQRNPRAAPEAEPVQFSVAAPQAQPAEVAPLVATPAPVEPAATEPAPVVPAEPAPAETAPAVAEHVDAPPQESPMPAAADAPQAGADAAPQ